VLVPDGGELLRPRPRCVLAELDSRVRGGVERARHLEHVLLGAVDQRLTRRELFGPGEAVARCGLGEGRRLGRRLGVADLVAFDRPGVVESSDECDHSGADDRAHQHRGEQHAHRMLRCRQGQAFSLSSTVNHRPP
jgi:hypothetical protein